MNGLLAVWNDCDAPVLERYEHWYMNEHLPDRVGLPGVQQGVRYETTNSLPQSASPRFSPATTSMMSTFWKPTLIRRRFAIRRPTPSLLWHILKICAAPSHNSSPTRDAALAPGW